MPTASLEFTPFMNTAGVAQGMGRARKKVAAGLRGMAQAAKDESKRIEDALASVSYPLGDVTLTAELIMDRVEYEQWIAGTEKCYVVDSARN